MNRWLLQQSKTVCSNLQHKVHNKASFHSSYKVQLLFLSFLIFSINDIIKASLKLACILYADDTTQNSTLDSLGNDTNDNILCFFKCPKIEFQIFNAYRTSY